MLPTLHISLDPKLSAAFDDLLTPGGVVPRLYSAVHPRYSTVTAVRQHNPCAQTVVLCVLPSSPEAGPGGGDSTDTSRDVFLFWDALQAPFFLSKAARATRALEQYLDAVCAATALGSADMTPRLATATSKAEAKRLHLRLHVVVAPNVIARNERDVHPNVNHVNVSEKDAAALFAAVLAWSKAIQARHRSSDRDATWRVEAGLLATAPSPTHAVHAVLACANKRLKHMTDAQKGAAAPGPTPAIPSWMHDVRPDRSKKGDPHDFHQLYRAMLTEVGSFSERKAIAAVSAFPTLHHLLRHVEEATVGPGALHGSARATTAGHAVYSTNFDESRSWNVVNQSIVDALTMDCRHLTLTNGLACMEGTETSCPSLLDERDE